MSLTLGFGIPAVNHVVKSGSQDLKVLVISPTRELATQTYENMKELTDAVGLHCVCIYGGVPKESQRREVKRSQCVIATPGRLLDLIQEGSISLKQVDYLILDEADRMLEKGFEEDIKNIVSQTNAQRQTLMFTATWPREVRDLASTFMDQPAKVSIGDRDELSANKSIKQIVEVIDPREKKTKLLQLLDKYLVGSKKHDRILIFALYKKEAARVERDLTYHGYEVAALHGDLSQAQRTQALDSFKSGKCNLMLATDVAARGLDIPNVKVVINLTFPLTAEDYVHRIGRTGRAGHTGIAHTLFTIEEKHLAGALMNVLRAANQPVPDELLQFGSYTKKKTHSAYGAFYKDVDMHEKGKKIKFD
ncbi:RNA-dependent ATPase [Brettanomyces nanus]|uniref:ATP-dependent RNA helicase DBP3 n=1 Tax=Eeniella nana TaxID=13502 RepID=A0A875S7R2_EENNA|nr:RNA-dependent ATPase [Brettanomyces nanus]QPG75194.1 RNA-dependent ATPase [Brettanomyces nanus]